MNIKFDNQTKQTIMRLHLEEGRTVDSLIKEYGMSRPSFYNWLKKYREECQQDLTQKAELNSYQKTLRLKKELAELKKENELLKKAAVFFVKEID